MKKESQINSKLRANYWNDSYVKYWKERVSEANQDSLHESKLIIGDKVTTSDKIYNSAIEFLCINQHDNVLELGCGFGRSLNLLSGLSKKVTAVDISQEMIDASKKNVINDNIEFYVSPSETLPMRNNTYDVVICFAAFDAMYQQEAIVEINRVSKIGARILLTGKNDNYYDDDSDALEAEIGARSKGHPNYFTDVTKLIESLSNFGFDIIDSKYFHRRGDFSANSFDQKKPDFFYEFLFVLKKHKSSSITSDLLLSNKSSKTYERSIS
tara:strand:+ start:997 stop:1803 length:807 start_codon:yes stop_codon:yes gene_type:complete